MSEDQRRERLTEEEQEEQDERVMALVAQGVKRYMQEQQQGLLHTAAKNSQSIVTTEIRANSSKVRDVIDDEVEKAQEFDDIKWKSKINRNNFDFAKQINDLWEKTERAVTEERQDRVKEYCEKGKKLAKHRLKVLHLADKDGWETAFEYLFDDLADDEQDRKRMKKAKRAAESKVKNKDRASAYATKQSSTYTSKPQGSNTYEKPKNRDSRTCWICGKIGHTSKYCSRNTDGPRGAYDKRY